MVNWNASTDGKLFLAVLKVHAIKLDYKAVAAAMSADLGEEVTPKALLHRMTKLKSLAGTSDGPTPALASAPDSAITSSPEKGAKATKAKTTRAAKGVGSAKTTKKRGVSGKVKSADGHGEGDGEEELKVGKKIKVEGGKFVEVGDDEEVGGEGI